MSLANITDLMVMNLILTSFPDNLDEPCKVIMKTEKDGAPYYEYIEQGTRERIFLNSAEAHAYIDKVKEAGKGGQSRQFYLTKKD